MGRPDGPTDGRLRTAAPVRYVALCALAATVATFLGCTGARQDPAQARAEAIVGDLYAAHQPWGDRTVALDQPAALASFFEPGLARLLLADAECVRSRREICNLGFDPIYDAQDFEAEKTGPALASERAGTDWRVAATIENLGRRTLLLTVTQTSAGWRISDIVYPDGRSLRALLSRPVE